MRIDRARIFPINRDVPAGSIVQNSGGVVVSCGESSAMMLEEVTPSGKKPMSAKSWANGARIIEGESFV